MKSILSFVFFTLYFISVSTIGFSQGCFLNQSDRNQIGDPYYSSGNAQLDQAIAEESRIAQSFFMLNCKVFYFEDNPPNAYFSPYYYFDQNYPDGSIVFGKNLLQYQLRFFNKKGEGGAIPFIFAHELGHAKANNMRWSFGSNKKNELFADFCAGMYLYSKIAQQGFEIDKENIKRAFYEMGDFLFGDPRHHGTPEERVNALIAGYYYWENFKKEFPVGGTVELYNQRLYNAATRHLSSVND